MKCLREQVHCATNEESLGIELVNELLCDFREELRINRRQRGFRDVSSEGPPPNYEPDVADEIPLAGIPGEPDLEGGGLVRAETDVNPPTASEPESENRVHHGRPEDELPPVTRRRIENEIAESVARNQVLDGVPQLANRGAVEGETGGSLELRERSRSPGRGFLAIADFHSFEGDDLEYVWNFKHSCGPGQRHRWESCKGEKVISEAPVGECEACYAHRDYYVAPKGRGDELKRRDISPEEWFRFLEAIAKEWAGCGRGGGYSDPAGRGQDHSVEKPGAVHHFASCLEVEKRMMAVAIRLRLGGASMGSKTRTSITSSDLARHRNSRRSTSRCKSWRVWDTPRPSATRRWPSCRATRVRGQSLCMPSSRVPTWTWSRGASFVLTWRCTGLWAACPVGERRWSIGY